MLKPKQKKQQSPVWNLAAEIETRNFIPTSKYIDNLNWFFHTALDCVEVMLEAMAQLMPKF